MSRCRKARCESLDFKRALCVCLRTTIATVQIGRGPYVTGIGATNSAYRKSARGVWTRDVLGSAIRARARNWGNHAVDFKFRLAVIACWGRKVNVEICVRDRTTAVG